MVRIRNNEQFRKKNILGLRMPEYEKLMVISAAKVAGISNIEELYINDSDQLDTRAITRV